MRWTPELCAHWRLAAVEAHRGLISRETLAYDPASPDVPLVEASAGVEISVAVARF